MIKFSSSQRGMTFIGFVLLMILIGFVAMLALKLTPIYLDHYKVVASLESLASDKDLASRSRNEIIASLGKRWEIDMIDSVTKDDVVITKDINHLKIQIVYDVTKPIMGNVDVLIHFDDAIEVGAN